MTQETKFQAHRKQVIAAVASYYNDFIEANKLTMKESFVSIKQIINDEANKSYESFCTKIGDTFTATFKFERSKGEPMKLRVLFSQNRFEVEGKQRNLIYKRVVSSQTFTILTENEFNQEAND